MYKEKESITDWVQQAKLNHQSTRPPKKKPPHELSNLSRKSAEIEEKPIGQLPSNKHQ